ncbi:NRT2.5, partial [Symbiodinium pilosum]
AQRLSDNSAKLWLSAETSACSVLVFGPDKDGQVQAVFGDAGSGGRGLVVRCDGGIAGRL